MTGGRTNCARIFFAVCFLVLMTSLGLSGVSVYLKKQLSANREKTVFFVDTAPITSFKDIYPFENAAEEAVFQYPAKNQMPEIFPAYSRRIRIGKYAVNAYLSVWNPPAKIFYHLAAALDTLTGNIVIENVDLPVVRLPNGHLTQVFTDRDFPNSWKIMREFSVWLKKRNIPLLQILPATKMDDGMPEFPTVVPRRYAQMIESYKDFLSENHILYLDAKSVLLAENSDFYRWFYRTDHHWTVLAGRLIAETTARRLKDELNIATDADAVKAENFRLMRYPAIFQGSLFFKVGINPDDFEVFFQRKESQFHLQIPNRGIDRTGGFNDTLIALSFLKQPDTYSCFLQGGGQLVRIENKGCSNGTRLLAITESQANVVCPYLACAVQYLDIIDPRNFTGSIKSFIEQTRPDAVLICI